LSFLGVSRTALAAGLQDVALCLREPDASALRLTLCSALLSRMGLKKRAFFLATCFCKKNDAAGCAEEHNPATPWEGLVAIYFRRRRVVARPASARLSSAAVEGSGTAVLWLPDSAPAKTGRAPMYPPSDAPAVIDAGVLGSRYRN